MGLTEWVAIHPIPIAFFPHCGKCGRTSYGNSHFSTHIEINWITLHFAIIGLEYKHKETQEFLRGHIVNLVKVFVMGK
jgi:hypothetical protein